VLRKKEEGRKARGSDTRFHGKALEGNQGFLLLLLRAASCCDGRRDEVGNRASQPGLAQHNGGAQQVNLEQHSSHLSNNFGVGKKGVLKLGDGTRFRIKEGKKPTWCLKRLEKRLHGREEKGGEEKLMRKRKGPCSSHVSQGGARA